MKLPRVVVYLAVLAAAVFVMIVVGAWIIPRLIDSQRIRTKISSELAGKTQGSLSFGAVTVVWLPRPSVVIENAAVAFGAQTQGTIRRVKIYPSMLSLLTGRWVVRQALLEQCQFRIRLPQSSAKPFNLEELEKEIRAALVALTSQWPVPRIELADGSAEITIGDRPALMLANLAAQIFNSPAEVSFDLRASSNLWERLKIAGRTVPQELAFELDIGVRRLKVKESLTLLALPNLDYLQSGEASLEMNVAGAGVRHLKASIDGSIGPLILARHGRTVSVEAKRFKGGVTHQGGALQADLEQLDLGAPRLQASATVKIRADSCAATVKIRDADIAQLGELLLHFADDATSVQRVLRFVPAGILSEVNFHSAARSCVDMAAGRNIALAATLRNGKVVVPGADLEFTNVATQLQITNDILAAQEISAQLGAAKVWNGKLRLGLADKSAPFHLDTEVHTSAPQLHSVLLKLVADERLRKELMNVQKPEGELTGRLILGETLAALSPVVAVSKANISAIYAPVRLPIKIRGARLDFDPSGLRIEDAEGSIGRSSFAGFGVTWHHDGSRRIKVDAARLSLDLQQMTAVLRGFQALRPYFTEFQSASGQLELNKLAFSGAYDEPAGWAWASTGSFSQVEIERADFPERISLSRGKFAADHGRMVISDSAVSLSDASFVGEATFEYKRGTPIQLESRGSANIGAQMTQWLSRAIALPEDVKLRSPLTISAGRFVRRADGDISFTGQVAAAGGAELAIDVVQQPQTLAVKNLTVDDGERRARMTFELAKDNLEMSFSGELAQQTIDKIFVSFPTQGSSLRGDIQVNVALADPLRVSARGQLSGSNLLLPLADKALIEKFNIEAGGENIVIQSAELRWGNSQLTVSGKVSGAKEILRVDLDVTGDQLDWGQFQRSFGGEGKPLQQKKVGAMSMPDVEGTIRFKTEHFTFEGFNLSALETTAAISPSGIRTEINRAVVCGMNTRGHIDVADKDIRLDLQLSATDAQLEPTTICLTSQQENVKGTYSLTARIAGRGDREHLRSALKGDFQLTARNGEFVRAPGIDATFDYLNSTGDFKVEFPDLDRETFPYRFVGVKGRFDGNMLIGDEVTVESSRVNLSGQGKVDLERKLIDGKALIAVLKSAEEVISRIPVIGDLFGGSLVGIPVRVTGSLERPEVTYLSPADVGAELLNLPVRILGIPLNAIRLFAPKGENRDTNITR